MTGTPTEKANEIGVAPILVEGGDARAPFLSQDVLLDTWFKNHHCRAARSLNLKLEHPGSNLGSAM